MPNNPSSINLLRDNDVSSLRSFGNALLIIGKALLIIVGIVAIIAFAYRFTLEQKLNTLSSEIKQKQNVLLTLKSDEDKYRNLQNRISLAATFSEKADKTNRIIKDVEALVPENVTLSSLSLSDKKVSINIETSSISSLSDLIKAMQNYKNTQSVSINSIQNKESVGLNVAMVITLK